MRFFFSSTSRTTTLTMSPTLTASEGCLRYLSQIWEMWTRPSWWTPMSTKTPKSMTLRTVPVQHVGAEDGGRELVTGVAARLLELLGHVQQGGDAYAALFRQSLRPGIADAGVQVAQPACGHVGHGVAGEGEELFRGGVALRVDGGVVQGGPALRDPEEARALLERLRPQLGDLQYLLPGGEHAVLLPIFYYVFCRGGVKPGHSLEERWGGGVYVYADGVDAVLHDAAQGLVQALLGHVVLVLADADGLGVDLHQLGQGVLEAAGDGDGGAQVHVVLGEFLRR